MSAADWQLILGGLGGIVVGILFILAIDWLSDRR